jgi:hypothetical protein
VAGPLADWLGSAVKYAFISVNVEPMRLQAKELTADLIVLTEQLTVKEKRI